MCRFLSCLCRFAVYTLLCMGVQWQGTATLEADRYSHIYTKWTLRLLQVQVSLLSIVPQAYHSLHSFMHGSPVAKHRHFGLVCNNHCYPVEVVHLDKAPNCVTRRHSGSWLWVTAVVGCSRKVAIGLNPLIILLLARGDSEVHSRNWCPFRRHIDCTWTPGGHQIACQSHANVRKVQRMPSGTSDSLA